MAMLQTLHAITSYSKNMSRSLAYMNKHIPSRRRCLKATLLPYKCSRSMSSDILISETRAKLNSTITSKSLDRSVTEISAPKGCTMTPEELAEQEEEMEEEEMFVEPHPLLRTSFIEWGGPRRGGRLEEPTRFGDWERKGRCTDF